MYLSLWFPIPNLLGVIGYSVYYSLHSRQTKAFTAGTYMLDAWRGCCRVDERGICVVDTFLFAKESVKDVSSVNRSG